MLDWKHQHRSPAAVAPAVHGSLLRAMQLPVAGRGCTVKTDSDGAVIVRNSLPTCGGGSMKSNSSRPAQPQPNSRGCTIKKNAQLVTCGGGSMKSNSSRLSTRSDLSRSTTLARLVRWISGTLVSSIS